MIVPTRDIPITVAIRLLTDARQQTRETGVDTTETQAALVEIINAPAKPDLIERRGQKQNDKT